MAETLQKSDESNFLSLVDFKLNEVLKELKHYLQRLSCDEGLKSNTGMNMASGETATEYRSLDGNGPFVSLKTGNIDQPALSEKKSKSFAISDGFTPAGEIAGTLVGLSLPNKPDEDFGLEVRTKEATSSMLPEGSGDSDKNQRSYSETSMVDIHKNEVPNKQMKKKRKKKTKPATERKQETDYTELKAAVREEQDKKWSEKVAENIAKGNLGGYYIFPALLICTKILQILPHLSSNDTLILLAENEEKADKALKSINDEKIQLRCKVKKEIYPERFKVYFENKRKEKNPTTEERGKGGDPDAYLCAFYMQSLALQLRYKYSEFIKTMNVYVAFPRPDVIDIWNSLYCIVESFLSDNRRAETVVCIDHQNSKNILNNKVNLDDWLKKLADKHTHLMVFGKEKELEEFEKKSVTRVCCDDTKNSADLDIGAVAWFSSLMNADIQIKIVSGDTDMYNVASQIQKCTVSPNPHNQVEQVWSYIEEKDTNQ